MLPSRIGAPVNWAYVIPYMICSMRVSNPSFGCQSFLVSSFFVLAFDLGGMSVFGKKPLDNFTECLVGPKVTDGGVRFTEGRMD